MKKLVPFILVVSLLCICVIGFMVTGASAEGSVYYVRSEANPEQKIFSSVDAALAAAEGETWGEDSGSSTGITVPQWN